MRRPDLATLLDDTDSLASFLESGFACVDRFVDDHQLSQAYDEVIDGTVHARHDYTGPNRTDRPRRAYIFNVAPRDVVEATQPLY